MGRALLASKAAGGAIALAMLAGTALGQIDANYIGANGGQWDLAANWDIGVIPCNTMTDAYNVFIPANTRVYWQTTPGSYEINDLTLNSQTYLDLHTNVSLTTLGNVDLTAAHVRLYGGDLTLTNPGGFDVVDAWELYVDSGGQLTLASPALTAPGDGSVPRLSSRQSSILDGSSLQTIALSPVYGGQFEAWYNGALLDLSNVTTISWGGTGQLYAYAYDGTIDLSSLVLADGNVRLHADNNGVINVGNASLPGLVRIDSYNGGAINAPGITTLEGVHYVLKGAATITLGPISSIDGAQFDISSGATYTTTHSTYSAEGYGNPTPFYAHDVGSHINASSVQSIELQSNGNLQIYAWYGGASVDLSGLDTVTGGAGQFYVHAFDGSVDLTGLDSVTVRTRLRADATALIDVGNTVVFDRLERLDVLNGSTISAPSVSDLEGVYFEIAGTGTTLNVGPTPQLDGAQFSVHSGASYTFPSNSYSAVGYGGRTPFHVQHAGSVIDASALQSLELDAAAGLNLYAWYSGAQLDLSGLESVTGGTGQLYVYAYDGSIDLTGLQNVDVRARLQAEQNGTVSVSPDAVCANLEQIDVYTGGTMNLPGLTSLDNVIVYLRGSYTLNTAPIVSADGARILTHAGATYALPAGILTYTTPEYSTTIFDSQNPGSLLDLSGLDSIYVNPSRIYNVYAWYGDARVDLSNLNTIHGSFSSNYYLYLYAYQGSIDLSGLQHSDVNLAFWADQSGSIVCGTDCISMGGRNLGAIAHSTLTCGGHLIGTGTGGSAYRFDNGNLILNGPGIHLFEVAGEDVGMPTNGSELDDFRVGHLVIGDAARFQTVIELRDCYDNGRRVGGTPEALYITGIDGAPGLEIASNATLVLNDIETYNWDGTQWVYLNELFGPGEQCIPYAGGQLCIGGCAADFNRDGMLDFFDVLGYLAAFSAGELRADFTCDGLLDFFDVQEFLGDFSTGCP